MSHPVSHPHSSRPSCAANRGVWRAFATLSLAVIVFLSGALPAWAQMAAASNPPQGVTIDRIETLAGADYKFTLQQILDGQAGSFKAQQSLELKDPSWSKSFWAKIYLRPVDLPGQAAALGSVLEISKPYIGDIALFSPEVTQAGGQWSVQLRGLRYPPSEAAIRSQNLMFNLPSQSILADRPEAMRFVMLRVQHQLPLSFSVEALPITDALSQSYVASWLLGMALGAIALVCAMMAYLAWLHRDSAYAWYAAYTGSAWLFCTSITGFSHAVMWPIGGDWPVSAIVLWALLAMASKLQFCRMVFLRPDQDVWLRRMSLILGILSILVGIGYILQDGYWTEFTLACFVLIGVCLSLILIIGLWGGFQNKALSKIWLFVFVPVIATIAYRLIEAVGWVQNHSVAFSSGIYILCLEVIVMGIAILWLASNRQGIKDRLLTLASTDPLTGFLDGKNFAKDLQRAWKKAEEAGTDVSLVYVSLRQDKPTERLLKRSVRILRTVTNEDDYLARLDERTLALLLPDLGRGDDLSAMLSRIVALGLIPDNADRTHPLLRLRIAAASRRQHDVGPIQLDADLRAFLASDSGWEKKSIRYLPQRASASRPRFTNTDAIDSVWDKALAAGDGPNQRT